MKRICFSLLVFLISFSGCSMMNPTLDETSNQRIRDAQAALEQLYAHTPGARDLGNGAYGILIFPEITKAGFIVGGQYGTGVLFKQGKFDGFYSSKAASYGLQAGVQKFGYALFFMSKSDLNYLYNSDGWEIGVGPTITVVDKGFAGSFTSTTIRQGVYAFFFEQRGLMAGLGIQGTKITRTDNAG